MSQGQEENWPPAYSVRVSARARRISLRLAGPDSLEVVLPHKHGLCPKGCRPGSIFRDKTWAEQRWVVELLERYKPWVQKQRHRLAQRQTAMETECPPDFVPDKLILHGGSLVLSLVWSTRPVLFKYPRNEAAEQPCLLYARGEGQAHQKRALRGWLRKYAALYLPPLLLAESKRHGLSYGKVSIKLQKTRWGSCSRQGNINLNAKLIFLPEAMVQAVLLHELCHTMHLNHSTRFWEFFGKLNAEAVLLDRAVNKQRHLVPAWL